MSLKSGKAVERVFSGQQDPGQSLSEPLDGVADGKFSYLTRLVAQQSNALIPKTVQSFVHTAGFGHKQLALLAICHILG